MMFTKTTLFVAAASMAQLASAVGNARIVNNCSFDVTTWSVGSQISDAHTLKTGDVYSEQFVTDPKTGGIALKVTTQPDGLYTGKPQTIFSYSLTNNIVWYDLSDIFGDAFSGKNILVASANTDCPTISWKNGIPPSGSQVKNCGSDKDVTLTLCAA